MQYQILFQWRPSRTDMLCLFALSVSLGDCHKLAEFWGDRAGNLLLTCLRASCSIHRDPLPCPSRPDPNCRSDVPLPSLRSCIPGRRPCSPPGAASICPTAAQADLAGPLTQSVFFRDIISKYFVVRSSKGVRLSHFSSGVPLTRVFSPVSVPSRTPSVQHRSSRLSGRQCDALLPCVCSVLCRPRVGAGPGDL